MRATAGDDEFFLVVIRMAVLYRLQERKYGFAESRGSEQIISKARSLVLRERGLGGRQRFENDLDETCHRLLSDQSGYIEMLVNRTLAGRGVITASDVREARRILNAPGGAA